MAPRKLRQLGFHCLLQQLPRPAAQQLRQRVRHRQRDSWILVGNYAIFLHGVFLLSNKVDGSAKTHQEYATFFFRSYTTFELNSGPGDSIYSDQRMYKAMAKTGIYTMTAEAFQEKYPDETYVYSMFAG